MAYKFFLIGGVRDMEAVREQISKTFTQFELTKHLLQNLKNFNLTPVAKLVLLELSSHYNEEKNNAVVFPSTPYIAETLGIGLTAAKKAINDLVNEGLIIKSKRDKVRGNYNKYLFTNKVRNTTSEQPENELLKSTKSDLFMRTNKKEKIKEQTNNVVVSLNKFPKGAEEKPVKETSSTTVSGFSKACDLPVNIPQLLKDKAEKGEIKNLVGYWKSLRPHIKEEYINKQKELDNAAEKKAARLKEIAEKKEREALKRQQEIENSKKPLNEQYTYQTACELIKNVARLNKNFAFKGLAKDLAKVFNIDVDTLLG